MSSPKFHKLTVKNIKKETNDSVSVSFHIPQDLQSDYKYIQGQYITIKLELNGEEEIRRSYSVCSSPLDNELRVGIKEVEGGKFSTFANKALREGDQLDVMTPMGNFYTDLHEGQAKNYVGIASGSGITPILSIMKTTLATEKKSNFTLLYGNKSTSSIMFLEEIEALKNVYLDRLQVFHILSREAVDVPILNGRINNLKCKDFCDNNLIDVKNTNEVFLCGPQDMIMSVKDYLETSGMDSKNIHFELFTTNAAIAGQKPVVAESSKAVSGDMAKVSVKIDGITYQLDLDYNGDSILDAALKTGADLPFACKGGVCCTCRAKVTEGSVSMDMNFSLEDDEVKNGYVLTCQSHPTSPSVFIDFDQK